MTLKHIDITDDDIDELCANEGWIFDSDRRAILKNLDSIDVQACPGSGKTTLIGAKLILLAKKWNSPHSGICVLSHTNVAKDEIINRLKNSKSPDSEKLLRYPHFIGTIQEFVDKFLALPYLRNFTNNVSLISDEELENQLSTQYWGKAKFTDGKDKQLISLFHRKKLSFKNFKIVFNEKGNSFSISDRFFEELHKNVVPDNSKNSNYLSRRFNLIKLGFVTYSEMYAFANYVLSQTNNLSCYLQKRFPMLLIDEMQDTQKFQDDLLQNIFQDGLNNSKIQRFGDPDQGIFNGFDGETANETYNSKLKADMFKVIDRSHRFNNDIANLIKGFSFNEVELESEREKVKSETLFNNGIEKPKHTIFLFDDGKEENAIIDFAKLIKSQFKLSYLNSGNFKVKALGGVGKIKDKRTIVNYNKSYSLDKAPKRFKPNNLIEAILFAQSIVSNTSSSETGYNTIIEAVLRFLKLANVTCDGQKLHTLSSLKDLLNEKGKYSDFRKMVFDCLNNKIPPNKYKNTLERFLALFDLTTESGSDDFKKFLEFEGVKDANKSVAPSNNIMTIDGINIEFSTIHGAKGETHDATLVMDTCNYKDDLSIMIEYLVKTKPDEQAPNSSLSPEPRSKKSNQKFMRQLYVAMSRPKHLLCLAMPKSAITETHIDKLKSIGWNIQEVSC